jgi:hypothetical protein
MAVGTRTWRDRATPADPEAWAALRTTLADARGLPAAWRDVLLDEAADLIDAVRRQQGALRPSGILTRRGVVKAGYRDYLELQPRLERVLKLLGLLAPEPEGQPLSPLERSREVRKLIEEGKI